MGVGVGKRGRERENNTPPKKRKEKKQLAHHFLSQVTRFRSSERRLKTRQQRSVSRARKNNNTAYRHKKNTTDTTAKIKQGSRKEGYRAPDSLRTSLTICSSWRSPEASTRLLTSGRGALLKAPRKQRLVSARGRGVIAEYVQQHGQ